MSSTYSFPPPFFCFLVFPHFFFAIRLGPWGCFIRPRSPGVPLCVAQPSPEAAVYKLFWRSFSRRCALLWWAPPLPAFFRGSSALSIPFLYTVCSCLLLFICSCVCPAVSWNVRHLAPVRDFTTSPPCFFFFVLLSQPWVGPLVFFPVCFAGPVLLNFFLSAIFPFRHSPHCDSSIVPPGPVPP